MSTINLIQTKNTVTVDKQIKDSRGSSRTVRENIPVNQLYAVNSYPIYQTFSFSDCPLNLFRNSGAKYRATLLRGSFEKCSHFILKFTLTVNNSAVTIVPTPYFFSRIDIRYNGSQEILKTFYGDTFNV